MAYNLLKGKKGIIFGALDEKSIAWQIALKPMKKAQNLHFPIPRLRCGSAPSTNLQNCRYDCDPC